MEITLWFTLSCLFVILFLVWYLLFAHTDVFLALAEKFGRPVSDLKGQIIWITGASAGLGEAMSYELASVGAKLVLSARNVSRLQEVKQKCLDLSKGKLQEDDVLIVPFDIADCSVHKERADDVLRHFGKIDILISNAGIMQVGRTEITDPEVVKEVFDVNFFGTASLTNVVLKHFLDRRKGHFVVISSALAKIGLPACAAYSASKCAVQGLYEAMRLEYRHKNIQVSVVCPGMFESSLKLHCLTEKKGEVFKDPNHCKAILSTSRCAHLTLIAVANKLSEAWISYQLGLFGMHSFQYCPSFAKLIAARFLTATAIETISHGKFPSELPMWKPVSH